MKPILPLIVAAMTWPGFTFACLGQNAKPQEPADLATAEQLLQSGKFAEAIPQYQQALKTNPRLVPAQAGLIRAYLGDDQVDAAFDFARTSLAAQPDSASLLAAMGNVQYRRGEFSDAQTSFLRAQKIDPNLVETYLGLGRIYRAASLYRRAYEETRRAHEIAPQDAEVQRAWLALLPRGERLKALEAYLSAPHADDAEENAKLHSWLEYLKATAGEPVHACKLANNIEKTEVPMQIFLRDTRHVAGYGLIVKINNRSQRLLLDTGASGLVISRGAAEKAGLRRISAVQLGGIGDRGRRDAFLAVADEVRIGDLNFKDCVITVSEKSMGLDEDGLIGADVFSSYVVDIDIPGDRLRLTPLPRRPEDTVVQAKLASEAQFDRDADEQANPVRTSPTAEAIPHSPSGRLPKDRYIAPEMADWAKVFRFGHDLLIPTRVNDSKTLLFVLDTGASTNTMSTQAAREITKVRSDAATKVKGLSGAVNNVYSADDATLQFGNIRQPNQDMVTFDLSPISKDLGVEVSGFLGFATFRQLEMKIDYRDGMVGFVYDPGKLPPSLRP
jgi:tetratricopeptide (TPR) repeat protein